MLTDKIMVVIDSTSSGAVQEMDRLRKSTKDADNSVSALGKTLRTGLVAGAAAFAGAGLATFLNDSVKAFGDGAKRAGELAVATGSSVEGISRMTAALEDNGVSAEQTAGLLTRFAATVGKNDALLGKYGVTLRKNRDGSIDYADAMVQVVDNISRIGDASKRQAALTEVFGRRQAGVFQELAASGVSLSDAMAAVSKYRVFSADDVSKAVAYDDAMDNLGASVQGLQFALGQALVPALSVTADALAEVVGVMSAIPMEAYAAVGGAVALKGAMSFFGPALSQGVSSLALAMTGVGAASDAAGGKMGLVKKGVGGIVDAIGPANLVLAALAAGITAIGIGASNAEDRLQDFASQMDGTQGSLEQSAAAMIDTSSAWERFWVTLTNSDQSLNVGSWTRILNEALFALSADSRDGAEAYAAALRKTENEMGAFAAASMDASVQQKDLNDLLAQGGYTAAEFADAASQAAASQAGENAVTEAAAVAMGMYATSIQGVVDWQSRLSGGTASAEQALGSLQDTLGKVGAIVDDPATWENEVRLNTAQATTDLYTFVGILANSGLTTAQIIPFLVDLQNRDGTSADADAIIQSVIDAITGKSNEVPPIDVQAALNPGSVADTESGLAGLTEPKTTTVTVETTYSGGGYEGAKARSDFLAQERQGRIDIATDFSPDGYNAIKSRADFLARPRTGSIVINTAFAPGSYSDVMARINNVARNRSATITLNTVTTGGGAAGAQGATAPINMFRVSIDGRELRSYIRAEMAAARPRPVEVLP